MTEPFVFLFAVVVLVSVGTAFLVLRSREPRGIDHGIKAFERHLKALSPESRQRIAQRVILNERPRERGRPGE